MARTETFHNMGFRLTYPDMFDHTLGQVSPMAFGDTGDVPSGELTYGTMSGRGAVW